MANDAEDNDAGGCNVAVEIGARQVAEKRAELAGGGGATETNPRRRGWVCVRVLIISTR